jgi:hypothetical protein
MQVAVGYEQTRPPRLQAPPIGSIAGHASGVVPASGVLPASGPLPASRAVELARLPDALAVSVPEVVALVEPVVELLAVVDAPEDEPLDVDPALLDDPTVASGRPEVLLELSSGG